MSELFTEKINEIGYNLSKIAESIRTKSGFDGLMFITILIKQDLKTKAHKNAFELYVVNILKGIYKRKFKEEFVK